MINKKIDQLLLELDIKFNKGKVSDEFFEMKAAKLLATKYNNEDIYYSDINLTKVQNEVGL